MTWSINNKEAWDFKIEFFSSFHFLQMFMKICLWEVSSTNLLSDTSCFSCLHICLSQLIKDQCFARIYVPHYTDNWTSKFFLFGLLSTTFLQFLEFFYLCSFPLGSVLLWVLNVIKSRWSISFFCFFLLCTLLCFTSTSASNSCYFLLFFVWEGFGAFFWLMHVCCLFVCLYNLLSNYIDSIFPILKLRLVLLSFMMYFLRWFTLTNLRLFFLNNLLFLFTIWIILIILGFSFGFRLLLDLFFILLFAISDCSMLFNFSTIFLISWYKTCIDCCLLPCFSCFTLL